MGAKLSTGTIGGPNFNARIDRLLTILISNKLEPNAFN